MSGKPALYAGVDRPAMSEDELTEVVRIRLRRGFDADKMPFLLESELGFPPELTRRAVARVREERAHSARRRFRMQLGGGGLILTLLAAVHFTLGSSRVVGGALFVLSVALGLGLLSWVWSELVSGRD